MSDEEFLIVPMGDGQDAIEVIHEPLADEWDDRAEMWDQDPYFARDLRAALSAPQPADAPEGHGDADEAEGVL